MTKTLKVGIASYEDFRGRTLSIAKGEVRPSRNEPKVWFRSMESLAKVLSDRNQDLLRMIVETHPNSVSELAERSGRAASNVSRTLKTMEQYGLVEFEAGEGKARIPRVPYSGITLDVSLRPTP